jgi:hypothetical protein
MVAVRVGDVREEDPLGHRPARAAVEPRPDDCDQHDRTRPRITGQLFRHGGRAQLTESSAALVPLLHTPSSAPIRPERTAFTNARKSCSF